MAKRKKQRYLPNHWQAIKDTPHKAFPSMNYLQVIDWKVANWALPSSISAIIRCTDLDTGKVKEFAYQRRGFAQRKVAQLMLEGRYEIDVVDHDEFTNLYPEGTK